MQHLQNNSYGISASALLILLAASQPVFGQTEFTMPASPTNDISADFAGVPAANLGIITDDLGDVARNPGFNAAWDMMSISFAYDRLSKELWVGVQIGAANGTDPIDFGTPQGGGDQPNLGAGEFLTGAIDLDNDSNFDLWFGVPTFGNDSAVSTALYMEDPGADGSTVNDYDNGASGTTPLVELGISSWTTSDTVGGEDSFQFMLDLDADPTLAGLLPDTSAEETVFNLQFDSGHLFDTYGEDRATGTVNFAAIPEPSSATLVMLGLCFGLRRKRQG